MLSDKELRVIEILDGQPGGSQRDLAGAAGLSLGMTNLLLRKLAHKGFVKIRQLNWKKMEYILTPKGMLEKSRKSFLFASRTLQQLRTLVGRMQTILLEEYHAGRREFYILAQAEAAELVEMALEGINLYGARIHRLARFSEAPEGVDVVFLASSQLPSARGGTRWVSLFEENNSSPRSTRSIVEAKS